MSAMQQPTPNHQSETFGSGQTQYFECEALSADHPEIQARERALPLQLLGSKELPGRTLAELDSTSTPTSCGPSSGRTSKSRATWQPCEWPRTLSFRCGP